jgi:16S rRNA (cytosine967-C5)-methyltransferase
MHPRALLSLASELLQLVLKFDAPADGVVSTFFRQNRGLGMRERAILAETTYEILRYRLRYQHLAQIPAEAEVGTLPRRLALLAWQGTREFLLPALTEHEKSWLEHAKTFDSPTLPEKQRHNLPDWLAQQLKSEMGDDFWPLIDSLNQPAPLDLRANSLKTKRDAVLAVLEKDGIAASATPYSPWGIRVQGKPALSKSSLFTEGHIEFQDEGSQLLALLSGAKRGETIIDFCAGGGGKTLALGAMMRNSGRLYAFDISGHRLNALKPRLARSGLTNVYAMQIAHEQDPRLNNMFGKADRVIVDAPCSGLGTLRRNPDLKWRQHAKTIQELAHKQQQILENAAKLLKPGGRLIYATCSLLQAENEAIADFFQASAPQNWQLIPAVDILQQMHVSSAECLVSDSYLRLRPHSHQTDGFFAAIWQKN